MDMGNMVLHRSISMEKLEASHDARDTPNMIFICKDDLLNVAGVEKPRPPLWDVQMFHPFN